MIAYQHINIVYQEDLHGGKTLRSYQHALKIRTDNSSRHTSETRLIQI